MSDTKWTPAEWDVDFLTGSKRYAVRNKHKYHIAAMIKNTSMSDGEDEANAHLIAASPTLYTALQRLVDLHVSEQEGISSGMPSPEKWMCAVDAAADALAKARGES